MANEKGTYSNPYTYGEFEVLLNEGHWYGGHVIYEGVTYYYNHEGIRGSDGCDGCNGCGEGCGEGVQYPCGRPERPLRRQRRLHRRALRGDAGAERRGVCDHRPLRAPSVLRRDRRHGEPAGAGRREGGPEGHPVRG